MPAQSDAETIRANAGSRASRVLAPGLAVSVGLWIVWLLLHSPQVAAPPAVAAPLIGVAWLVLAALFARRWNLHPLAGAGAGLVTALAGLLLLGSMLVRPHDDAAFTTGESSFIPGAIGVALAFLAAGAILGAVGSLIARPPGPPTPGAQPWQPRLAWVVAASFFPLLLLGGVVTSTESGLAVTDWPRTFGANMFLYPKELMQSQPRVFVEHTHCLFGTLAGLCTMAFWVTTLLDRSTRWRFGIWATVLFVAVCVQGYLGGARVVQQNAYLGAFHGAFGQVIMAFAATLALWMSPSFTGLPSLTVPNSRTLRLWTTVALHAALLQLLFGALFRHLRRADNPGASHVVWAHAAFALAVVAFAVIGGALLIRFGKRHREELPGGLSRRLRTLGAAMHGTVGLQFVLGWFTLLAVLTGDSRGPVPTADQLAEAPPVPLAEAVLATLHQANGALFLVLVMLGWAWGRRIHRAARAAPGNA